MQGGILKYLEEVPAEESMWEGHCFVFDNRVAVDHSLEKGPYEQCNACRMPITAEDQESEHFEKGVSCPHCYDQHSEERKMGFRQREYQMELARKRGDAHIGDGVHETIESGREAKREAREASRKGAE